MGARMPIADLPLPVRLLAGGGPSSPDRRVLHALTTPLIGQFDPAFTATMDEVMQLARQTFLTRSPHCFAISALPGGGLEAVLNSVIATAAERVAVVGSPAFAALTSDLVRRCGAEPVSMDHLHESDVSLVVAPFVDPFTGTLLSVQKLATTAHANDAYLILEATGGLAACELRVDDWSVDVCVAGADYAVGAPSGMSLVTYSDAVASHLQRRAAPPPTSYLDLVQLQAYWSPERLNHHTAPTSLVYGLHEALRLVQLEGLAESWSRHVLVGEALRQGLRSLGLETSGDLPYSMVHLPQATNESEAWQRLLEDFGIHVSRVAPWTWRLGLLGADARLEVAQHVLLALEKVLTA
jgi:(S)-ureidoglycine-glyoxylate aminotransferase